MDDTVSTRLRSKRGALADVTNKKNSEDMSTSSNSKPTKRAVSCYTIYNL